MKGIALISIHDVHSGNYQEVEGILQEVPLEVRSKVALMVVPRHFSQSSDVPFFQQSPFLAWLCQKKEQGHELFLHGLYHKTKEKLFKQNNGAFHFFLIKSRSKWGGLVNQLLVDNEAEFMGLTKERMEQEIAESIEEYQKALGEQPTGWVFPTWYGKLPLSFLQKKEILYTESRWRVYCLSSSCQKQKHSCLNSLAISWPRSRFWIWVGDKVFFLLSPFFTNIRFVLHPGDQVSSRILAALQRVLIKRSSLRYSELFKG